MPVAQSRGHAGKALLVAGAAIVLITIVTVLVALAASRGDVEIRLGDERFDAGLTDRLAAEIDDSDGLPFLYQDLVDGDRNLFVQHTGEDPDTGWVAFGAFDPDEPTCLVELDRERSILVNRCDTSITYPLSGDGLRFYPTTVEDGRVYVDINELTTTTTTPG